MADAARVRGWFAVRIVSLADLIDEPMHHLGIHVGQICLLADVGYGWGPDATDWHRAGWLCRWAHRWLP